MAERYVHLSQADWREAHAQASPLASLFRRIERIRKAASKVRKDQRDGGRGR